MAGVFSEAEHTPGRGIYFLTLLLLCSQLVRLRHSYYEDSPMDACNIPVHIQRRAQIGLLSPPL